MRRKRFLKIAQPPRLKKRPRTRLLGLIPLSPLHKIKLYLVFYPKSLAMKPLIPSTNQVSYGRARESPNLGWALARILLKLPAKKENIPVTQRVSYLRYVHALVQQQMLRSLDPHLNDV